MKIFTKILHIKRLELLLFFSLSTISFQFTAPFISSSSSSSPLRRTIQRHECFFHTILKSKNKDNEEDDYDDGDEEEEIDLSDRDWRAFRAKLVMQPEASQPKEKEEEEEEDLDGIGSVFASSAQSASLEELDSEDDNTPTQWAYDSGNIIEKGAVILGGVEQDYGFGLRQQYFHKVVMLVLDHSESDFTKGIILNRPTDMTLEDSKDSMIFFDSGNGSELAEWRVWFGGDVQGLDSVLPHVVCLHSIVSDDEFIDEVSETVLKDIKYTSFENAKVMVERNLARPEDFWVFVGYAGWGPKQLDSELERKSWYMLSTDSQTLLQNLARQSQTADPRDAGLQTWEQLMEMIHKEKEVVETRNEFDDLMLKEWARNTLCSQYNALGNKFVLGSLGSSSSASESYSNAPSTNELKTTFSNPLDRLLKRAADMARGEDVAAGSIVRASSAIRSPFLLTRQEFHKSLLLIIADDDNLSCGVMLNQPASKGLGLEFVDRASRDRSTLTIPLRYGGEYMVKGQNPLLWLHCSNVLKKAQVGSALNLSDDKGIWKCTSDQATTAMAQGIAKTTDFMVVSGVSVWTKGEKGLARGIQGEVRKGNFDVVDSKKHQKVWDLLLMQELLQEDNLKKNLDIARQAWIEAGGNENKEEEEDTVIEGIGEGYDEDNEYVVYKSDVKVSKLSDDALRNWVASFLLGAPTLA